MPASAVTTGKGKASTASHAAVAWHLVRTSEVQLRKRLHSHVEALCGQTRPAILQGWHE